MPNFVMERLTFNCADDLALRRSKKNAGKNESSTLPRVGIKEGFDFLGRFAQDNSVKTIALDEPNHSKCFATKSELMETSPKSVKFNNPPCALNNVGAASALIGAAVAI